MISMTRMASSWLSTPSSRIMFVFFIIFIQVRSTHSISKDQDSWKGSLGGGPNDSKPHLPILGEGDRKGVLC